MVQRSLLGREQLASAAKKDNLLLGAADKEVKWGNHIFNIEDLPTHHLTALSLVSQNESPLTAESRELAVFPIYSSLWRWMDFFSRKQVE